MSDGPGRPARRPLDRLVAGLRPLPRHVLAEEHHVRLEHAMARAQSATSNDSVASSSRTASPSGLRATTTAASRASQPGLAASSRRSSSVRAVRCPHDRQMTRCRLPCSSVTAARARGLVQAVHVLGDDPGQQPAAAQLGDGAVAVVGHRPGDVPPADEAAGPVPAPCRRAAGEGLVRHRRRPPGQAGRAAVVRDARLGGQPGAAQDERAAPHVDERAERAGPCPGQPGRVHGQSAADLIAWDTAAAPSFSNMIV